MSGALDPEAFLIPKHRLTTRTVLTASPTHSLDSPGVENFGRA